MSIAVDTKQYALELLRRSLANPHAEFRDGQWEAIERLVDSHERLLVVQRTGWGKSLVYFLATRILRDRGAGPTLIISPLLSLMRNQVAAARRLDVRAATINTSNYDDWQAIYAHIAANDLDVLLISPERLSSAYFMNHVLLPIAQRVGLLVVDEAHCVSDWGHDFRPDYRRVSRITASLAPAIPVLATTATANNRVVEDLVAELGPRLHVLRGPLTRSSLRLQNIRLPGETERLAWLAEQLPHISGNGIIYTLTIKDAQTVAAWLQAQSIDAHAYHSLLDNAHREDLEERLLRNDIKALVATTALSMGFDKPDLGFVIHYQRPASVIHYYQQVGRAGRALDHAFGILLGGDEDDDINNHFMRSAFPHQADVEAVLNELRRANGLSLDILSQRVNLTRNAIDQILRILAVQTPATVHKQDGCWYANSVQYTPDYERIERLLAIRIGERERMEAYTRNDECLMRFLARELDDPQAAECGRCAVCVGAPLLPETASGDLAKKAVRFLRANYQRIEAHNHWPEDALADQGWSGGIPFSLQAEPGRALCIWGDDGWGELVRRGKQQRGSFDYTLVAAVVTMLRDQWRPTPAPTWVTCVPSLNHPELVPTFAQRVADVLRLPFVPCVRKIRSTPPQKQMQNDYQQARNLSQAFSVDPWSGMHGPVLLLDDMVDSGWTFAVVAALLRGAGSGPVFPLALARANRT